MTTEAQCETGPGAEPERPQPSAWGTQRRLMALMNRSWAPQAIQRATGIPAAEITNALTDHAAISPGLAERVAAAYDRLWDQQPPRATPEDRQLAAATAAHARRRGWPPPMAYDDDLIDLPGGAAAPGWQRGTRTKRRWADFAEDIAFVREHGGYRQAPLAVVAMRLGVTRAALEQAHSRATRAGR
jgi:hypothetical protein